MHQTWWARPTGFFTFQQFQLLEHSSCRVLSCCIVTSLGTIVQGPIVFLNVATNFEHNLNILCQVCRGHLVRCNDHVSVVIG